MPNVPVNRLLASKCAKYVLEFDLYRGRYHKAYLASREEDTTKTQVATTGEWRLRPIRGCCGCGARSGMETLCVPIDANSIVRRTIFSTCLPLIGADPGRLNSHGTLARQTVQGCAHLAGGHDNP